MDTAIEASFTPEVSTYNIVSGLMSNDCKPFRIAQGTMLWLHEDGFLGELECIFPQIVDKPLCSYATGISQREGFPQFEVRSLDNEDCIQNCEDGFIAWLVRDTTVDLQVCFKNVHFFFSIDELVAIEAHQVLLVE
ncbi:MAG: hypothetical protein ACJ8AG_13850 [Ktedonobacteraceae bacterium]